MTHIDKDSEFEMLDDDCGHTAGQHDVALKKLLASIGLDDMEFTTVGVSLSEFAEKIAEHERRTGPVFDDGKIKQEYHKRRAEAEQRAAAKKERHETKLRGEAMLRVARQDMVARQDTARALSRIANALWFVLFAAILITIGVVAN